MVVRGLFAKLHYMYNVGEKAGGRTGRECLEYCATGE